MIIIIDILLFCQPKNQIYPPENHSFGKVFLPLDNIDTPSLFYDRQIYSRNSYTAFAGMQI